MSTRNHTKSAKRKAHRRKKALIVLISLIPLLFFIIGTYIFFQYEAGKSVSEQEMITANESKKVNITQEKNHPKITNFINTPENHEPINILLVGVDKSNDGFARTDTIMIAQYNPLNGESKIASIMRDSYVKIPERSNNKINAAFAFGGVKLLSETIEQNFNLKINYYALINFNGFVQLVDTIAPNGLNVDIEERMHDPNNSIDFLPGKHRFNGEDTLNYVRFRKDRENDFGRVRRQQEIITLLKNELFTVSGIVKIPKLIGMIEPLLETNIHTAKLLSLSRDVVLNPVEDIQTLRIPIEGSYEDAFYQHAGSVLQMDIDKNTKAIEQFFSKPLDPKIKENQ
jgi:LCP family protein required for cell wall assembly